MAREIVRSVDFASPNHATVGPRFASWQHAVDHARSTIRRFEYPGQVVRKDVDWYHPRRFFREDDTLVVYGRAFVHMRVVTRRPDGGTTDSVECTWEVFQDGTVERLP